MTRRTAGDVVRLKDETFIVLGKATLRAAEPRINEAEVVVFVDEAGALTVRYEREVAGAHTATPSAARYALHQLGLTIINTVKRMAAQLRLQRDDGRLL